MDILRRFARFVALCGLSLVVLAVSLELGANLYYAASFGELFYTRPPDVAATSQVADMFQPRLAVLHPYFGFVNNATRYDFVASTGTRLANNNHGFPFLVEHIAADPACCDFPHARRPDEVIVGVFGGSVGVGFATWAQQSPAFVEALQRDPRFAGKRVNVLTFALSAYKQPQQLAVLANYLAQGQTFDVVINIDGFNETVNTLMNWKDRLEPTYPADAIWGAIGRALEQGRIAQSGDGQDLLAGWHERQVGVARAAAQDCRFAACYAVYHGLELWHGVRQAALRREVQQANAPVSWFPAAHRYTFDGPDFDLWDYTADRWRDSSVLMHRLLAGSGALYLHVLQPNQWFRASGPYVPIAADHPYGWVIDPINEMYPRFLARADTLRAAGVPFLDATHAFPSNTHDIYADDACHYTPKGNEILALAIADALAKTTQP